MQDQKESRHHLIMAQELVRKEVANLLHSQVQSQLIVLEYCLKDCLESLADGPPEVIERLTNARGVLRQIIEVDLRSITRQLYPSIIQIGLASALNSLADRFRVAFSVELEVDKDLQKVEGAIPSGAYDNLRLPLYRIAEEACTNAAKHAQADKVRISLKNSSPDEVHLAIQDNGRGFDPSRSVPGHGLLSMKDYAGALGGKLEIDSSPGWGTAVRVWLPVTDGLKPAR